MAMAPPKPPPTYLEAQWDSVLGVQIRVHVDCAEYKAKPSDCEKEFEERVTRLIKAFPPIPPK
jgi:hypothetical protein